MDINLIPTRADRAFTLEKRGDVLVVNGEDFDFTPLPEGGLIPREAIESDWFAGDVERIGGELRLTLLLPHGANAPEETRFPVPVRVVDDGPIALPPFEATSPVKEMADETGPMPDTSETGLDASTGEERQNVED